MADVEIYVKGWCPFCRRALALLDATGARYRAIDVTRDPEKEQEMRMRSRRSSVPQIFIDGSHVGGFDDLDALRRNGRLDVLLGAIAEPSA